jgi:hypothetical protein
VPLYVLISPATVSAEEDSAFVLKDLGRTTVIGEPSAQSRALAKIPATPADRMQKDCAETKIQITRPGTRPLGDARAK